MSARDETQPSELAGILGKLRTAHGEDIVLPSSRVQIANTIPTGAFILDFALMGGIPEGYCTMFYGPPSCGKTTLLKKVVGNFQKKHPEQVACWVDTEGMFDPEWATKLGVDTEALQRAHPTTAQQAIDVIIALMGAREIGLIVLDSIPGCVSNEVLKKSAEEKTMAELARLMGLLCSKILMSWARERRRGHWVTVLLVNQFRYKVGLVFGDNRTLPGGTQINHLPTTKLELKNNEEMGTDRFDNEVVEYNKHTFKITKAKHGSSIRTGEFRMSINPDNADQYATGEFMDAETICTYAKRMGILTGGGSSWRLAGIDTKFGKIAEATSHLRQNPDARQLIAQTVIGMQRQTKGLPTLPPDGYLLDWCETR